MHAATRPFRYRCTETVSRYLYGGGQTRQPNCLSDIDWYKHRGRWLREFS